MKEKIFDLQEDFQKLADVEYWTENELTISKGVFIPGVSVSFTSSKKEFKMLSHFLNNSGLLFFKCEYFEDNEQIHITGTKDTIEVVFCILLSLRLTTTIHNETTYEMFKSNVISLLNKNKFDSIQLDEPV